MVRFDFSIDASPADSPTTLLGAHSSTQLLNAKSRQHSLRKPAMLAGEEGMECETAT
jgi:hypothetical protein